MIWSLCRSDYMIIWSVGHSDYVMIWSLCHSDYVMIWSLCHSDYVMIWSLHHPVSKCQCQNICEQRAGRHMVTTTTAFFFNDNVWYISWGLIFKNSRTGTWDDKIKRRKDNCDSWLDCNFWKCWINMRPPVKDCIIISMRKLSILSIQRDYWNC